MDITGALAIVLIFGGGTLFLLAISPVGRAIAERIRRPGGGALPEDVRGELDELRSELTGEVHQLRTEVRDRKSTRLNSSHGYISYAVFCLKKKKTEVQT